MHNWIITIRVWCLCLVLNLFFSLYTGYCIQWICAFEVFVERADYRHTSPSSIYIFLCDVVLNVSRYMYTTHLFHSMYDVFVVVLLVFNILKTLLIAYLTPTPNCHILFSNKNYAFHSLDEYTYVDAFNITFDKRNYSVCVYAIKPNKTTNNKKIMFSFDVILLQ